MSHNIQINPKNTEVVTLGECMALFYPVEPIRLVDASNLHVDMAGAETNLCIALARLGHSVRFISKVGKDPFGEKIKKILTQEGVDIDSVTEDEKAPTGIFFREWLPDGQRRVYYYRKGSAASELNVSDIKPEYFNQVKLLHLTGITPALSEQCLKACYKAIDLARTARAVISFDPNYRAPLWDPETARKFLIPLIRKSNMVLMGHEDAHALFGKLSDVDLLKSVADLDIQICVLKRAEKGVLALADGKLIEIPAAPAGKIMDPVGAGDGFDAGFLSGWLRGWSLENSLKLGATIGAAAVSVMGDYDGYPRTGFSHPSAC
jgi:2-dehydro-3-deoxygluconokinase